ncbi:hypothetical protein [Leptospira fletcheri]|uniref:hypothetical protein n=1 Tax=Leptospira fletcheri TaxID=2484981 RepID=UPI0014384F6C|nr:hypothetical protein [Leptospira fletcheri]
MRILEFTTLLILTAMSFEANARILTLNTAKDRAGVKLLGGRELWNLKRAQ